MEKKKLITTSKKELLILLQMLKKKIFANLSWAFSRFPLIEDQQILDEIELGGFAIINFYMTEIYFNKEEK